MVKNATILLAALGVIAVGVTSARAGSNQGKVLCYVWADQASPAVNTPYTPDPTYSFNAKHKDISISKVATGVYSVQCVGESTQNRKTLRREQASRRRRFSHSSSQVIRVKEKGPACAGPSGILGENIQQRTQ